MINLKELEPRIIFLYIVSIFLTLFVLISIFLGYHPELVKMIETKNIDNKKMETYALHLTVIQFASFFLSAIIVSFIRRKKDYLNGLAATVIFLLPFFLLSFNLMNIIYYILSIITIAFITFIGIWFGYYLRPPIKEDENV